VEIVGMRGDRLVIEVGSGEYRFTAQDPSSRT
jgi:alpha-L-rhamnosidase